jgi:glycosyltransferase involved in cell wall biosynthesis
MAAESTAEPSAVNESFGRSEESSSPRVVVGIPAYNEAIGIGSTVVASRRHADRVVVVDDGSSDATAEIAELAGASVISHGENRGKGAAIGTLLDHARAIECDCFILLDADGQHVPADIPSVVGPVLAGEADLVIGSRYLETNPADETPLVRRVGQRVLDGLLRAVTGAEVTDTQCGFRALSTTAVDSLSFETDGMGVESEMIDDAVRKDLSIREVPIEARYDDIDGQTFHPIRHGVSVVYTILRLVWNRNASLLSGVLGLAIVGALVGSSIRVLREIRGDGRSPLDRLRRKGR